jgi:hypothetical protein
LENGSRRFQYRASLFSLERNVTPVLRSVTIYYNRIQRHSLLAPVGGESWTGVQNISWSAGDGDGDVLLFDIHLENDTGSFLLAEGLPCTPARDPFEWSWNTTTVPNGTCRIKVVARDDNPLIPVTVSRTSGNFTIHHPMPPNRPPRVVLVSPANNSVINTTSVLLAWNGSDPDGDPLNYTCRHSASPDLQGAGRTITTNVASIGLSDLLDNTTYYWTVDADDGFTNRSAVPAVIWSFRVELPQPPPPPVNHPPRITSVPPATVIAGEPYVYNVSATDEDNDSIALSFIEAPDGAYIHPVSGAIRWQTSQVDIGNHTVHILASDDHGGFGEQVFTISVLPAPTPEKPWCRILSPLNGSKHDGKVQLRGVAVNGSFPIKMVQVRLDSGTWTTAIGRNNWSVTVDLSHSPAGRHTIEARAFDGAAYSDPAVVDIVRTAPGSGISVASPVIWPLAIGFIAATCAAIYLRIRRK